MYSRLPPYRTLAKISCLGFRELLWFTADICWILNPIGAVMLPRRVDTIRLMGWACGVVSLMQF